MWAVGAFIVVALIGTVLPDPDVATRSGTSPFELPGASASVEASPAGTSSPSPESEDHTNATVTRVVDGDTIKARFKGRLLTVRLIGVDAPETVHPTEPIECFGPAASKFVTRVLEGERVRLEFDVEHRDQFGRTLAYVWVGNRLFNEKLVRDGYANVSTFPPNVKYVDRFRAAQRNARSHDRGLWGRRCAEPPPSPPPSPEPPSPSCTSGYSPCLPLGPSDYDCAGGEGNGPAYSDPGVTYQVSGSDPYGLDADADGFGCE
jgi:micrococcal nuclease